MSRSKAICLTVLTLFALACPSAQGARTFKARLSPVAIDLTMMATVAGTGSVTALLTGTKLEISGTFDGLKSPATVAQIRRGPVTGVPGQPILDLPVDHGINGKVTGTLTLSAAQIGDLEKGRLYVQLASEKAPDGNLWGWLLPEKKR
jgi:hypothetical protein